MLNGLFDLGFLRLFLCLLIRLSFNLFNYIRFDLLVSFSQGFNGNWLFGFFNRFVLLNWFFLFEVILISNWVCHWAIFGWVNIFFYFVFVSIRFLLGLIFDGLNLVLVLFLILNIFLNILILIKLLLFLFILNAILLFL